MTKEFPTLFGLASTGVKEWTIRVDGPNFKGSPANITTVHGLLGGKKQTSEIDVPIGKNIGKLNEITPFQRACSEAKSKWRAKMKSGYRKNETELREK